MNLVLSTLITLTGIWSYDGFLYEGVRYPKPNPDLTLSFTFNEDGTDRLYWIREGDTGFCERIAEYSAAEGHLKQKIVWVNPRNDRSCASDPDMRLGAETDTPYSIQGDELWFHLELNGKPFYYILKFQPQTGALIQRKVFTRAGNHRFPAEFVLNLGREVSRG